MVWKIILVLGTLGMLLGGAVAGIAGILVLTSGGRTSLEEGMLGIIPGVVLHSFWRSWALYL